MSPSGGREAHASGNLEAPVVVYGIAKLLLTAEASLKRLDGGVVQRTLNLAQFSSCYVAEPDARTPYVVRS